MKTELAKTGCLAYHVSWLALILVALSSGGCKDGEWPPDPPPDYYYCLKATFPGILGISVAPGQEVIVTLSDGPCSEFETWKNAEHRPVSEALPYNVQVKSLDEGITITPTGLTTSNQIRVSVDAGLLAKPWLLSSYPGQSANVEVTLKNPRPRSKGYKIDFYVWVENPNKSSEPVKKPDISLRFAQDGSVSLGNVKVASEASQGLSVYNSGTEDATIAAVALGNCSPSPCPFQVAGPSAGEKIPAGSYRTLTVTFKPTVAGYASADLFVHPTQGNTADVRVSGTGQ